MSEAAPSSAAGDRSVAAGAWGPGDSSATAVLVATALSLTLTHYYGRSDYFRRVVAPRIDDGTPLGAWARGGLGPYCWALAFAVAVRVMLPALALRATSSGANADADRPPLVVPWSIVAVLTIAVVPILWWSTATETFAATYPYWRHAGESSPAFYTYSLIQLGLVMTSEFFFRGVLVLRLSRALGAHAVLFSTLVVGVVHVHRPFPELALAVVLALGLGALALQTRRLWPGVVIAATVALTTDLAGIAADEGWRATVALALGLR